MAVVYTGNPDRLSLAVVVMEHDYGDPDYYRDEVNTFVAGAIAVASKLWPAAALLSFFSDNIVDAINWILGTGDDVISSEVKTWERPALEAMATQAPGPLSYNPNTGLFVHFVTTHHGDGSKYIVGFDIERDPPWPSPPLIIL